MIESKIDIANITFTHPSDWNVIKIKYLLSTKVTDGPHETPTFIDEGYPFLSVDSIVDGKLVFEGCRYISKEDYDKYKLKCNPQKDDIFMGKAASIGKIAIVDVDFNFSIWSPLALLRPNQNIILPKYLEFALKSDYVQDQIDLYSTSNTQKNISMDDIPRIELLIPNMEKQKVITTYLIKQTSKIDAIIAKNEELIQLLEEKRVALINQVVTKGLNPDVPMKDSGVEWIGEIPEHWNVVKLKFCTNIINDKKDFADKDDKYVGLEHIESETGILLDYSNEGADGAVNKFKKDMVLFGKLRPYLAKVINTSFNGVCSTELLVFKTNESLLSRYLFYFMLSNRFIEQVNSSTYGVKMPRASPDFINSLPIALPNTNEQKEVVDYLDSEITNINNTILKIKENIALLEEYKTSLIHHVVTGKIDVRGEEI
jgi:restriction endonuclease S subunit